MSKARDLAASHAGITALAPNATVSVRFQNKTGGTVDLGAGVLKALVFRAV